MLSMALAFCLDRASKNWALAHLNRGDLHVFWPGLIDFDLITNTGAAFSVGHDQGDLMKYIALAVTIILALWSIRRLLKSDRPFYLERIGAGLILGGSLGNLFDRFNQGFVTDFIRFAFIDFPVFNIADALIDVGVALILFEAFKKHEP